MFCVLVSGRCHLRSWLCLGKRVPGFFGYVLEANPWLSLKLLVSAVGLLIWHGISSETLAFTNK